MKRPKKLYPSLPWIFLSAVPVFLILFYLNRASSFTQFKILSLAVVSYLAVATFYHLRDKTLNFEIILEYILISALALVII